jgi:hypothetical protein
LIETESSKNQQVSKKKKNLFREKERESRERRKKYQLLSKRTKDESKVEHERDYVKVVVSAKKYHQPENIYESNHSNNKEL